jgi:hypothetical protein
MSYHEYKCSQELGIQPWPFYSLIMAAMRQADTGNIKLLKEAFPKVWEELEKRYHAPGGVLPEEVDLHVVE